MELKTKYEVDDVVLFVNIKAGEDTIFNETIYELVAGIIEEVEIKIGNSRRVFIEYKVRPLGAKMPVQSLTEGELFTNNKEINEYVNKLKKIL